MPVSIERAALKLMANSTASLFADRNTHQRARFLLRRFRSRGKAIHLEKISMNINVLVWIHAARAELRHRSVRAVRRPVAFMDQFIQCEMNNWNRL